MKDISYKLRLDNEGATDSLEIIQGKNIIIVSLASGMMNSSPNVWSTIKKTVDSIQERVSREASEKTDN